MHLSSAIGSFIKPLSLKFINNRYHLFYLFSPTNQLTERSVGHATSADMVNWKHQSILLLDASNYHPIGIFCDSKNTLGRFPSFSNENLVVYYLDQAGIVCCNYWDVEQDSWPLIHNVSLPLASNIKQTVVGIANDIDSNIKVLLVKNVETITLEVYNSENTLLSTEKVNELSKNNIKSFRIDIGRSLSDNNEIVILLTAYIKDSNTKSYIKYFFKENKITKLIQVSEKGTSKRMLSLAAGRILEFGTSDNAQNLMTLPSEIYLNNKGLTRKTPLELLNCFNQTIALESGAFTPITSAFRLSISCHSLKIDESISLALFSNQAPLLKITKQENSTHEIIFGYDSEKHNHIGSINSLNIIVDGGIVELRNDNLPVFIIDFGKLNSINSSILICPPQVNATISSLIPYISREM